MARSVGGWIKFRTSLVEDGRVKLVARKLGISVPSVLGGLVILWSIGDARADENGEIFGWTLDDMNRAIGIDNFCQALAEDWLVQSAEWVTLPNYMLHNGSTAKQRANSAKDQALRRDKSAKRLKKDCKLFVNEKKDKKSTVSISISRSDLDLRSDLDQKKIEKPLVAGCEHLRLDERELGLARTWFAERKFDPQLFRLVIEEVDLWLGSSSRRAQAAKKRHTHRLLFAAWAIESAGKKLAMQRKCGAVAQSSKRPEHKIFKASESPASVQKVTTLVNDVARRLTSSSS